MNPTTPMPPDRPDEFELFELSLPAQVQFEIECHSRTIDRMLLPEAKQQLKELYYSNCALKELVNTLTKQQFDNATLVALAEERSEHRDTIEALKKTSKDLSIAMVQLGDRSVLLGRLEVENIALRKEIAAMKMVMSIFASEGEGDR